MLTYPHMDPVLVAFGPVFGMELKVHWYGMMYLFGFMAAFWLANVRSQRSDSPITSEQVDDLILYGAFGVVLGGRIGYVFFYGFDQFLGDPLWLFRVWDGGMSFHGGLLGVMFAMWLFARKIRSDFVRVMDFIVPMVPIGLGFGRLGNFINQELWGRVTDVPWAMVFPNDPFGLPRHPSQLYQFALEGVALFVILFLFSRKPRPRYAVSALFLMGYGVFRFLVEFVREPDSQIGFDWFGWMTRGQELCVPMILAGAGLWWFAYRNQSNATPAVSVVAAPANDTTVLIAPAARRVPVRKSRVAVAKPKEAVNVKEASKASSVKETKPKVTVSKLNPVEESKSKKIPTKETKPRDATKAKETKVKTKETRKAP